MALVVGLGVALLTVVSHARADSSTRRTVSAMRDADDKICNLLRAQPADRCKQLIGDKRASVYQSGTARGVNRVVLAIVANDHVLIGPNVDLVGEDCATGTCAMLESVTPTIRDIAIDGRPGVLLEVVAKFHAAKDRWQTRSIIGCGQTAAGAWKCTTIDAARKPDDRCEVTISDDGTITSCGAPATLSLR